MIDKKVIYALDLILIVVTGFVLLYLIGYARPLVIAPLDEYSTTENQVLFEFKKGEKIIIDDNLEFSSPEEIYAEENLVVTLDPGTYYWKISGVMESEVRMLTILSKIELRIINSSDDGNYELVNAGNVDLDVEVYSGEEKVNEILLKKDESAWKSGNKFIGGEQ